MSECHLKRSGKKLFGSSYSTQTDVINYVNCTRDEADKRIEDGLATMLNTKISGYSERLDKLETNVKGAQSQILALSESTANQMVSIGTLETSMTRLNGEISSQKQQAENTRQRLTRVEGKNNTNAYDLKRLSQDVVSTKNDVMAELNRIDTSVAANAKTIEKEQKRAEELAYRTSSNEKEIMSLTPELKSLRDTVNASSSKLDAVASSAEQMRETMTVHSERIASIDAMKETLESHAAAIKAFDEELEKNEGERQAIMNETTSMLENFARQDDVGLNKPNTTTLKCARQIGRAHV